MRIWKEFLAIVRLLRNGIAIRAGVAVVLSVKVCGIPERDNFLIGVKSQKSKKSYL